MLLAPVVILATWFYFDGLFLHQSVIHGDAIGHGFSVLSYHSSVLDGKASMFWTDKIYGGHPIYAEGQFAFFSPLNTLVALLFSPEVGQNVFHWACLVLTGIGTFVLARGLRLSGVASAFASIVVTFSSLWIGSQQNLTISGTLVWIPWALWAFNRWLSSPRDFLPLAVTMCLLVVSGYPQILHGTAIYMFIALLGMNLSLPERVKFKQDWKRIACYGALAAVVCIGLAAVQLIPLIELVSLSHRTSDVTMWAATPTFYFLGFLFSPPLDQVKAQYFPILGSVLVCVLASLLVITRPSARILAHCLATLFLVNLGLGSASPIFSFLYEHHLLPGLHFFRLSYPYFGVAIVGIALMAASAIDGLKNINFSRVSIQFRLAILVVAWCYILYSYRMVETYLLQYILLALAVVAGAILIRISRREYLAPLLLALLLIEVVQLKIDSFVFYDNKLLEQPASVSYFKDIDDIDDYKMQNLWGEPYSFLPPLLPDLDLHLKTVMAAITPSTNLLWGISNLGGAHALPLGRRMLIADTINSELLRDAGGRVRLRISDFLGIRYIVVKDVPVAEGVIESFRDPATGVQFAENTAARPRFQTFTDYMLVESAEAALAEIERIERPLLLVEKPGDENLNTTQGSITSLTPSGSSQIEFTVLEAEPTSYRFQISAKQEGWFFIADANYPGWLAFLDNNATEIYHAQVLGKAVWIPQGEHELVVQFRPVAFRVGLALSIGTICLLIAWFAWSIFHSNSSRVAA